MKKLLLFPLFLVIFIAGVLYWFYNNSQPVSTEVNYLNFNIPPGSSAAQIGSSLYRNGLIKSATAFKIYIQFTGMAGSIQSGNYRLSPSLNLYQVASILSKAPSQVRVTIPEGLRREEIAHKFAKSLDKDQAFVNLFLEESKGLEGYLFPDTYMLPSDATPGAIIARMKDNFTTRVDSLIRENSDFSSEELLIMASLIERETRTDEERPIVAGILMNRISSGWPLQVDATVQYALANTRCKTTNPACAWWEPVGPGDLAMNSPFNTYKNPGLPPAPIANPGLSAIKAAYAPEDSDYFFYIHDSEGKIHYAKTLEEQNANIDRYLR